MAPPMTTLPRASPGVSNTRAAIFVPSFDSVTSAGMFAPCDGSDSLEDPRGALAHADAHGDHAVLQILAAKRVHDCRRADSAGGAQRVPECDRAAHRVHLLRVQADRVDDRER